jgi:hypothetical protein
MDILPMANREDAMSCVPSLRWPLERVLFALAGTMTLLSAALSGPLRPKEMGHA